MRLKTNIIIISILILAAFLRLYKIAETLSLEKDVAGAYLIADNIIREKTPVLVGPITSFSPTINVNPPIYYNLIALLVWIFKTDLGVTLIMAISGALSVYFIFLLGKEIADTKTGLLSGFLYAISYTMIYQSRHIWEPFRVPFFIILPLLFAFRSLKTNSFKLLFLSMSFYMMSLIYISSYLIIPSFLILITLIYKKIRPHKSAFIPVFYFFLLLFILYLPTFYYEFSHNFPTIETILTLPGTEGHFFDFNPWQILSSLFIHTRLFLYSIFLTNNIYILLSNLFLILVIIVHPIIKRVNKKISFIAFMFISSLLLTGFYAKTAYTHRMTVLYPLFFILFAYSICQIINKMNARYSFWNFCSLILFVGLLYYFSFSNRLVLYTYYFKRAIYYKNRYQNYFKVADVILKSAGKSEFAIYGMTPWDNYGNDSNSYYYAMEKLTGRKIAPFNQAKNWIDTKAYKKTNKIYLICKDYYGLEEDICFKDFLKISGIKADSYDLKELITTDFVYTINIR